MTGSSWGSRTPPEPLVELRGVGREFRSGEVTVRALDGVDLRILPGEHVSVVGPSGSGKSTLLNVVGLLDRFTDGTYRFEGIDVGELPERGRTALRSTRIGFVFQSFHLISHRSVLDNVMLGMLYTRVPRRERRERAEEALDRVGLRARVGFLASTLSGGERQRVAVARAIVGDPALLLCDEPTGNLDSATGAEILDLFDELSAGGLTLVVVTHDPAVSARGRRTVTMRDGVLTEELT